MTRKELQARIKQLSEMQQAEMTKNAETMCALKKRYNDIERKAADELNDGKLAESIRYKKAIAAIEAERQCLFADYKAQKSRQPEPGDTSVKAIVNPV